MAVIGFGTGITAGTFSLYPQVQGIQVFEMSPLVGEFAPLFDPYNHGVTQNAKIHFQIGDAFQKLLADPAKYSVIASEPSNPWVTGVERLYSKEFLTLAAERLEPGGIYAQWFHEYDLSLPIVGMVINTFAAVFPEVHIFKTTQADLVLIGSKERDWPRRFAGLEQKWTTKAVREDLERMQVRTIEQLLTHEIPIPPEFFARYGEHTLEFPKLAYRAGFEFFLNVNTMLGQLSLTPALKSWVRRYAPRTLASLWLRRHPGAATLEQLTSAECGGLFSLSDLEKQTPQCQQYMVRLALVRQSDWTRKLDPVQTKVVDMMDGKLHSDPPLSAAPKAESALKLMSALDSPSLTANKEAILELAQPCLRSTTPEGLSCRLQLIRSLATIGEVNSAYVWYKDLMPYVNKLPPRNRRETLDVISEAVRLDETKPRSLQ